MFRTRNKAFRIHDTSSSINVKIANGKEILIRGIGELKILFKNTKGMYMLSFSSNLLSVGKLT